MKVFINQFEDKFEWHNWFKDMMDEQDIKYNFKERGDDESDIEDKKEKADFIVYIFTEDTEPVVEHATNALLDSKNHSEKVIYRILEDGKNIDKSVLETLKRIESEVEDNGSKIVNAPAHAINYIKYVEKEGEEYKGDNPNEDESEENGKQYSESINEKLIKSVGGVSDSEIDKAEKELDVKFPEDLKKLIKKYGSLSIEHIEIFGLGVPTNSHLNIVTQTKKFQKKENFPDKYSIDDYVVISMIMDGVFVVYNKDKGIYEWDQSNGRGNKLGDNINDYLSANLDSLNNETLIEESPTYNGDGNVNKISNSNVFKYLDNVLDLQSKIDVFLNNAREVDEYNCEIGFKLFERENPPYKNMVMDMMRKGKIKLLYNEDSSLSRSLMFIPMFKNQDDFVLYVNVTSLAKEKEVVEGGEKSYEYEFINNKALSNVLISGYALLKTAQKPNLVSFNQKVKKSVFELYSEMMLGTINRIGSLSNDKDNAKIVRYILAKFFYLGMLGREHNDKIEESCINLSEAKGIEKVEVIKMKHENEEFKNISSVLELITSEFPQLEIDLSSLVKVHTMLYGEGTLLTIDYVPYIVALAFAERFRFAIYTSSKNLRKNFKLQANDIQVSLMDKLK